MPRKTKKYLKEQMFDEIKHLLELKGFKDQKVYTGKQIAELTKVSYSTVTRVGQAISWNDYQAQRKIEANKSKKPAVVGFTKSEVKKEIAATTPDSQSSMLKGIIALVAKLDRTVEAIERDIESRNTNTTAVAQLSDILLNLQKLGVTGELSTKKPEKQTMFSMLRGGARVSI